MISASRNPLPRGAIGGKVKRGEELLIVVSSRVSVSLYKTEQMIAAKLKLISEAREFYNGIEQKYTLMTILPIFPAQ